MHCPYCGNVKTKVINSRVSSMGDTVRRRRLCYRCDRRFSTIEALDKPSLTVIKRNGEMEPFNREKIIDGLKKACRKRPVSPNQIKDLVLEIEKELYNRMDEEVTSEEIGEMVLKRLRMLDEVAYLRFASVYRKFNNLSEFDEELKNLLKKKER
ncbi:MAG: transcriptional regulator NrdR [Candidatus Sumerlaeia bacterium]|nr:transcriptional regulator NrdR [Candidatus Sumerlaeia bacterium]